MLNLGKGLASKWTGAGAVWNGVGHCVSSVYVAAMTRLPFGLGAFVLLCFGPTVWFSLPDVEMSVKNKPFFFHVNIQTAVSRRHKVFLSNFSAGQGLCLHSVYP